MAFAITTVAPWSCAFSSLENMAPRNQEAKDEVVFSILTTVPGLLGMKCGRLCSFILPICLVNGSFSWNLDTKFCLRAAGGIFVYDKFEHSGGKIEVSNSSAKNGGTVLRSSSWVFGRILRWL